MNETKFSLTLRQCRRNAGLSQKQVAEALGVERSTYAYYETGTTRPSCEMVIKLSKVFNVHYSVFMDAISDKAFDESEDGNGFTTLNYGTWEERAKRWDKIYTLSRAEQSLVLAYRTFSPEQKANIAEIVTAMRNEVAPKIVMRGVHNDR